MKNLRAFVIVGLLFGSLAFAGGVSGGGGKTVVTRDNQGKKVVQLLDLWEAENIYGRKINYSNAPVAEQVSVALNSIKHALRHPIPNRGLWKLEESAEATSDILES